MLTLTRILAATAVVAVAATAPASAATKKRTFKYSATVLSTPVSTANGYPAVGGTALNAGSLKSAPFGEGAVIDRITITGQPQPDMIAFKGTEVDYFAAGSQRNTFTGIAHVQADGSLDVTVKGTYTGGTGRYKGATGSYTFTGSTPAGSTILSGRSSGTLTF